MINFADIWQALLSWLPMILIIALVFFLNRGGTSRANRSLDAQDEANELTREIADSLKLIAKLLEERKV